MIEMTDQLPEVEVSTEAASTNFYWTIGHEELFNLQTTVRGVLDAEQVSAHLSTVISALKEVVAHGGHAKQVGASAYTKPAVLSDTPPTITTEAVPEAEPVPERVHIEGVGTYDDEFEAVELVGSSTGGKNYWKVKGGRFTKFGVTIWPEALKAAGFAVDKLDVSKTYRLDGYVAYYITTEKDGKVVPDKVIALRQVQVGGPAVGVMPY